MGRGQTEGGKDLLDAAGRHPRRGLPHGGPQTGRGRMLRGGREQLAGRAHQPQPVVAAPHQGLFAQKGESPRQGTGDGRITVVTGQQTEQLAVRRRVRRHGQRLRRLQREPVQPLQRTHHRGTGACPGGELGEVGGHGSDEVGAAAQEGGQGDVVPRAERFREGPGGRGLLLGAHPANVSGWVRRWGGACTVRSGARGRPPHPGTFGTFVRRGITTHPPRRGSWGSRATRSSTSI